jgi:hypothetical protein
VPDLRRLGSTSADLAQVMEHEGPLPHPQQDREQ